tara:strand:- start:645 stop:1061 length:417 start_codon:yes stop_codon:yes gene_type:complete
MSNNDYWYNREYERYTGFRDQPDETPRQRKLREEYSDLQQCGVHESYPSDKQVQTCQDYLDNYPSETQIASSKGDTSTLLHIGLSNKKNPDKEAQEILDQLQEIHSGLDEYSEKLKNAERLLNEMGDFLNKLGRKNES